MRRCSLLQKVLLGEFSSFLNKGVFKHIEKLSIYLYLFRYSETYFLLNRKTFFLILLLVSSFQFVLGQTDSVRLVHKVELGENLYRISLKYDIPVSKLRELNNLNSNAIRTGQNLFVGYKLNEEMNTPLPNKVPDYLQRLERMVENAEALYYESVVRLPKKTDTTGFENVARVFEGNYTKTSKYELIKQFNDSRASALKSDIGLGFYSAYTYNFRPGVFDGEDLFFRNRASIGLDWRLLGSGLRANKDAVKQIEIENELNELLQQKDAKSSNYVYTFNYIIYLFNKAQIVHLERRKQLIDNFLDLASDLYLVRAMPWERILELKSKRASLESMLKNLNNYNQGFDSAYVELNFDRSLNANYLPVMEIDPSKVFSGVSMDSLQDRTLELEQQRLELNYRKNKDFNLRTYARYNLFDSDDATIRTFGSVGATFTAPLFKEKRREELQEKELAIIKSEMQEQVTTINNELMNHYYEYEYTLKQYIDFLGKKELAQEKLRRELTKDYLNDPNFTPLNTVTYLDELYAIDYELLDLKQKLYIKLLKIYSLLDVNDVRDISEPIQFSHLFDKMAGNRAVYVWSESLQNYETEFLIKYALNNEFDRLFLSQGQLSNEVVLQAVKNYQREGASVYRLVGKNSLAENPDPDGVKELAETIILQGFDGVQFDIEPHTFNDWDSQKDVYLNNIIQVLQTFEQAADGYLKVSISLPVFYPEDFLSKLEPLVDEVVLMAYERKNLESIVNAIQEEVKILGPKLSLALRTQEFNDRLELEDFLNEVINGTGINNVVVHDLNSLIKLDQKTILGK